jgi:hypothetical protein
MPRRHDATNSQLESIGATNSSIFRTRKRKKTVYAGHMVRSPGHPNQALQHDAAGASLTWVRSTTPPPCRSPYRSSCLPAARLKARRWAAGRHVVLLQAQNRHVRAAGERASRDGSGTTCVPRENEPAETAAGTTCVPRENEPAETAAGTTCVRRENEPANTAAGPRACGGKTSPSPRPAAGATCVPRENEPADTP